MVVEKRNDGISLISLIITIIVIIILAAIVIFSGMDTPEKAQLSKVISDIDNVQTAVDQAYSGLYTEKAVAGEVWTQSQFYEAVATGETDRNKLSGDGLVEITEDSLFGINLPQYEGRKWYIAVSDVSETIKVGSVVLSPGFESAGKTYSTLLDVQTGGSGVNGGSQGGEQDESSIVAKLEVGDYVKYEADSNNLYTLRASLTGYSSEEGKELKPQSTTWRVWKTEGDKAIIMPTSSVNSFWLDGSTGFVNSVDVINDVCKIYANEAYGVSAEDIRNLTIEDLEEVSTNLTTTRDNFGKDIENCLQYGQTNLEYFGIDKGNSSYKGYTSGTYYTEEDGMTISKNGRIASSTNPIVLKQTFYFVNNVTWKNIENTKISSVTYGELLGDSVSSLSSPCVDIDEESATFYLRVINSENIGFGWLTKSENYSQALAVKVRPLVSLSSSKLKVSGGDGTEASPWTLEKK